MRRSWTAVTAIVLVLLLALFAVACGGSSATTTTAGGAGTETTVGGTATTGGAGGTIKIASLYPTSGDLAKLGEENVQGLKLAIEEINAAGGIKSMGGAKIELIEADSQGKPDVAISEVERLVQQENVAAIVGTYQSKVALPATQAAERLKTPFVVSMAVADDITGRGFKYTFRICPKAEWYAKDQVAFLKDLKNLVGLDVKKVALLHEDTDFGTSTAEGQKKYLKEAGMEMVAEVPYPASAADLTTQVSKIKAANPDVVLMVTYLNDSILIAQAKEKLGMKQLFFDAAGGTIDPEFIKRLGTSAENILTEIEYTKYAAGAEVLNDKFKAKYGNDITGNGAYAYQAGWVLADALERAGSADREALRTALAATNMPKGPNMILPTDKLQFGPDGQNMSAPLFVMQIQGGELKPVWPAEYAAVKVQLPQ
ncbi:MAG: ABC transporter substrate-binding protein [Actinobacteria bacterium]|nr:ABC transporter substrate-binding protein [Actinomycetota bacterium]